MTRIAASPAMIPAPKFEHATLIIVDDDPLIGDALKFTLADEFNVVVAGSREQARTLLHRMDKAPVLALVDLGLPPTPHSPAEGFALIAELLAHRHAMKILVLSGQSDRGNVQQALSLGAVDFLPKPCDADLLRARLRHQLMLLEAEGGGAPSRAADDLLIGSSPGMQTLRALIKQFANSPFPVLIEGESGVGKELVAMCLHRESRRAAAPLLNLNCSAFSPDILEAQLFGAAKGAYTGADRHRIGLFEAAGPGTLFLDEVGEMPPELQSKLLRVLENGEYYRLGESQPRFTEARVLTATNRDLRDLVRRGAFRADLFHRLSVLTIGVPPLRNRDEDWSRLLEHFLGIYRGSIGVFTLTAAARARLANYAFPGNIRELRNIVVRLGTKYGGQVVDVAAVNAELEPEFHTNTVDAHSDEAQRKLAEPGFRLDLEVANFERRLIVAALAQAHGNLSRAARVLGINRTTLYSKLSRLEITPPPES